MRDPKSPLPTPAASSLPSYLEYRRAATLLGWLLVHVQFGRRAGTRPEWVKAWIGDIEVGGAALSWKGTLGGLAIAHEYAQGGMAIAQHGGDEAARAFFQNRSILSRTVAFMKSFSSP
jgi:hypothetical protein